jgi:FixJ family two-component response regulator
MTTISVIDDDPIVREAIADLISSLGYEVATYESAEHFLESDQFAQTSCLITDLQMPGLNGLDLQRRLIADRHSLPIIFVTAFPNENYRQRAMSAEAIGFLSKPFDDAALIECLKTALSISADKAGALRPLT